MPGFEMVVSNPNNEFVKFGISIGGFDLFAISPDGKFIRACAGGNSVVKEEDWFIMSGLFSVVSNLLTETPSANDCEFLHEEMFVRRFEEKIGLLFDSE